MIFTLPGCLQNEGNQVVLAIVIQVKYNMTTIIPFVFTVVSRSAYKVNLLTFSIMACVKRQRMRNYD